jgi:hypothetical protein
MTVERMCKWAIGFMVLSVVLRIAAYVVELRK